MKTRAHNAKDLSGQVFGELTVVRYLYTNKCKKAVYECKCNCGKTISRVGNYLTQSTSKTPSCGCMYSARADYRNQKFGKLTPIRPTRRRSEKSVIWEFLCDCGTTTFKQARLVSSGGVKSCGCLKEKKTSSSHNLLFYQYKRNALKRGIKFALTKKSFSALTQKDCHYCGAEPRIAPPSHRVKPISWNGVDRVDNSRGYYMVNCVPCCKLCNRFKGSMGYSEFLNLISKIHRHQTDGDDEHTRTHHVIERNAGMRGSAILKHIYDFIEVDNLQKADILKLLESLVDEHIEEEDHV